MRPLPARPRSDSLLRRLLSAYGLAHRPPLKTDATACCSCSHADAALPFNLRCWFARLPADLPPPSAHSSTSSRCWEPSSLTCAPSPVSVCARARIKGVSPCPWGRVCFILLSSFDFSARLLLRFSPPSLLSVCLPARPPSCHPTPRPAARFDGVACPCVCVCVCVCVCARLLRLPCSCIRPSHFPSPHKRSHPHSCTFALARPPPRRRQSP